MYINKAFIGGNLTRDPETKALPNGSKVTTFSVATNRVWKDASGMRQEATEYHNVVVFGRQATQGFKLFYRRTYSNTFMGWTRWTKTLSYRNSCRPCPVRSTSTIRRICTCGGSIFICGRYVTRFGHYRLPN